MKKPRPSRKERRLPPLSLPPWWRTSWIFGPLLVVAVLVATLVIRAPVNVTGTLRVSQITIESSELGSGRIFNRIATPHLTLKQFATVVLGSGWLTEAHSSLPPLLPPEGGSLPATDIVLTSTNPDSAVVNFKKVRINQLKLPQHGSLQLVWSEKEKSPSFTMTVTAPDSEAPVRGHLIVEKPPLWLSCPTCQFAESVGAGPWWFQPGPANEITFEGMSTGIVMRFALPEPIEEDEGILNVQALDFFDDTNKSTLMEGTITIVETQEKVPVGKGEGLILDEVTSFRLHEVRIDQGINLKFSGRVGKFQTRTCVSAPDCLPTYFEWIYYAFPPMLWYALGGLGALGGLITGVVELCRMFGRKGKERV